MSERGVGRRRRRGSHDASRQRAAARSREAILDAAERLFTENGCEPTSLKEVGEATDVSRNIPSYFFDSKERLHRARLYRTELDRMVRATGALMERAKAHLPLSW